MLHLVTGGSGSGKSAFAEDIVCRFHKEQIKEEPDRELFYIATMIPYGNETGQKIARHRQMRAQKGFQTIECYTNIEKLAGDSYSGGLLSGTSRMPDVLLECVSNLTANEMYESCGAKEEAAEFIIRGIRQLAGRCAHLVVVTNNVSGEYIEDSGGMAKYVETLSKVNHALAKAADSVTEVVYGIPVTIKGMSWEKEETKREETVHMKLIVGGAYEGKRSYAESIYGIRRWADGAVCTVEDVYTCEGVYHFERLIRRLMKEGRDTSGLAELIAQKNPDIVIVSDEIGCGLVPADAFERAYREQTGRILTETAALSEQVDRVICGTGTRIKGGSKA